MNEEIYIEEKTIKNYDVVGGGCGWWMWAVVVVVGGCRC